MSQSVSDLNRVTNFTGLSGNEQAYGSTEESVTALRLSIGEMGRQLELELDRVYGLLRNVNTEADQAASDAESNAIADGGLWEYVDGQLVPKDPDA